MRARVRVIRARIRVRVRVRAGDSALAVGFSSASSLRSLWQRSASCSWKMGACASLGDPSSLGDPI